MSPLYLGLVDLGPRRNWTFVILLRKCRDNGGSAHRVKFSDSSLRLAEKSKKKTTETSLCWTNNKLSLEKLSLEKLFQVVYGWRNVALYSDLANRQVMCSVINHLFTAAEKIMCFLYRKKPACCLTKTTRKRRLHDAFFKGQPCLSDQAACWRINFSYMEKKIQSL